MGKKPTSKNKKGEGKWYFMKYCHNCGTELADKAEICPTCGVWQARPHKPKSRMIAAVLAIFLGGLGMHKFYLGQGGMGLLYLLFCWSFIPAIIGLFEGLRFLVMKDEVFERQY